MEPLLKLSRSFTSALSELTPTESYVELDDVRIIPGKIVFAGAFDGKVFNQSFTIINCGKYTAFVRIMPPSSKTFKMKPLPKGRKLSAGMSISRNISYIHTSAMALPECSFSVYINEKPVIYQIEVTLNYPLIVLTPNILDFGQIDVQIPSQPKTIRMRNNGKKKSSFSMDMRKTESDLIVKPMNGTIDPSQVIEISVEVLGSVLGPFSKEFWIKTEPPQRVRVIGEVSEPRLRLLYPLQSHRLAVVDFSRTYYGATIRKPFIIKNDSSVATMFCVVLEINKECYGVEKAKAKNDDLECFDVSPKDGRLQAGQVSVLQFTFQPKQTKSLIHKPYKDYAIVFLRIVKIYFRDGTIDDHQIKAYETAADVVDSPREDSVESILNDQPFYLVGSVDDGLQLCLYGEMEMASVELTPSSFYMTYLKINKVYTYDLNIKNHSTLPIIVSYNKIACVDVEPKQIHLLPESNFEVALTIKPSKIGPVDVNVVFNLTHKDEAERYNVGTVCLPLQYSVGSCCIPIEPKFNSGITPKITNEVGFMTDDVRFNSRISKPIQAIVDKNYVRFNKDNNDLIAFPNDRPKSLRPRKDVVTCRTIYANIPRYSNGHNEYALNELETDEKERTRHLYIDYIRNSAKCRRKDDPKSKGLLHYDISDEKRVLLQEFKKLAHKFHKPTLQESAILDLPLSPSKLIGIKINPKYIELGKLAPHTSCKESFTIENDNEFAINVSIKAKSNAVFIKGKNRLTIQAQTTEQIFFDCTSCDLGQYYVPVYIIVNEHHIFDTLLFANVVPMTVLCPIDEISINMREKAACFEIVNPINCDVTFSWEIQGNTLGVFPPSGKIPPNRGLYCRLKVDPFTEEDMGNEVFLISQSGAKQIISVVCEQKKAEIGFSTQLVKFENIPLNTTVSKVVVLRNFSDMEIMYNIQNKSGLEEITVRRVKGRVAPKCDIEFEILAKFKDVVQFECSLEIITQNLHSYFVNIKGNVIYPDVLFEPQIIQFRKLPVGTYQRKVFRVTNVSQAECFVDFSLEDFEEFFIADMERHLIELPIYLEPNEARDLFLEFIPVEPLAYSIYLPYVVNGIIGPPALNDHRTLIPSTYFSATNNTFMTTVELPQALSTVAIRCAAGARWVEISSLEINFFSNIDTVKFWTATNVGHSAHCLTVPLVDPESCFGMDIENGNDCKIRSTYHETYLKPSEQIVFRITFKPTTFGVYNLEIPIFFDKSVESCPMNYLKLTGTYKKPVILCSKRVLYYQTVYVKERVSETVTVKLLEHEKDCAINVEVGNETLSTNFTNKTITPEGTTEINVLVAFHPKETCFIDSEVTFKCSCDASCKLIVKAGSSSCAMESYAYFMKYKASLLSKEFKSTFPFFPSPTSDGFYAARMSFLLDDFEKFLFILRLFGKDFLKIPDSLCGIPVSIRPTSSSGGYEKPVTLLPPLVNILIFLIKPTVQKYFIDSSLEPNYEGVEGAVYLYTLYRNIIIFLRSQNVFVPQLEPEHLMNYELYTIFKTHVNNGAEDEQTPPDDILSPEDFFCFSKQCWLDLLLKLVKVFVLDRILNQNATSKPKSNAEIYYKEFKTYFSERKQVFVDKGMYIAEVRLLLWLEFHYEHQKELLFDLDEYPELRKPRKFTDFEEDFSDGIAIATVIFAYCPYLKDDLKKFYPVADCSEKTFHNICLVQEVMKKIKLPGRLIEPGGAKLSTMQMLLMGSYLYDVLPGFYPGKTVEMSAALGETAANEITLKNDNDFTVAYTPVFFSNDKNYFSIDCECLVIQPKKGRTLTVTYHSRSIQKIEAVLVLSGETEGFKSAKSVAIYLVGIPKILEFTESHNAAVDVFVNVTKHIEVNSPFEESYTSKLYLYREDVSQFISVSMIKQRNLPRQFCIEPTCTFESGVTNFRMDLCYVCVGDFSYNIYFVNEDVGDFCIQINITVRVNKNIVTDLEVAIGQSFSLTVDCSCKTKSICTCKTATLSCPKLIVVNIPCKNDDLVEAIRKMYESSTEESEHKFWNKLLEHPKGVHILRNRLEKLYSATNLPYINVLRPMVKYRVEFSKSKVSFPKHIMIDNSTSSKTFKFPLHWNYSEPPQTELMTLYAEHGQEVRRYQLNFQLPEQ